MVCIKKLPVHKFLFKFLKNCIIINRQAESRLLKYFINLRQKNENKKGKNNKK